MFGGREQTCVLVMFYTLNVTSRSVLLTLRVTCMRPLCLGKYTANGYRALRVRHTMRHVLYVRYHFLVLYSSEEDTMFLF